MAAGFVLWLSCGYKLLLHTMLSPDAIAETYWGLHSQDPTAWTLELDLRPFAESF